MSSKPTQKSDYEIYIRTDELLKLQKVPEQLACHDELQFQMVHQVEELWMKLMVFTLEESRSLMERALDMSSGEPHPISRATNLLDRAHKILGLMTQQIHLLETMTPNEYHKVRTSLGHGSGSESPGFARIRKAVPTLWPVFEKLLEGRRLTLLDLHSNPETNYDLYLLSEGLLNIDQGFVLFREHHLQLVRHIIGGDVPSLKGVHASKYLEHELKERFFPELWDVRNQLSKKWGIPVSAKTGLSGGGGGCPMGHGT